MLLGSEVICEDSPLEALREKYRAKSGEIEKPLLVLDSQVKGQLKKLYDSATTSGNLDYVKCIKEESDKITSSSSGRGYSMGTAAENHPGLREVLKIYIREAGRLNGEIAPARIELMKAYCGHLLSLERSLTQEKKLTEAVAVREELTRMEKELKTEESFVVLSTLVQSKPLPAADRPSGKLVGWGKWIDQDFQVPSRYDSDRFVEIVLDHWSWAAIRDDGRVVTALAPGFEEDTARQAIVDVPALARDVVAIAHHSNTVLALRSDGDLIGWGTGSPAFTEFPREGLKNVVEFGVGFGYGAALHSDGTVTSWGNIPNVPNATPLPDYLTKNVAHIAVAVNGFFVFSKTTDVYRVHINGDIKHFGSGFGEVASVSAGITRCVGMKSDGSIFELGENPSVTSGAPEFEPGSVLWAKATRNNGFLRTIEGKTIAWGLDTGLEPAAIEDAIDVSVYSDPGWYVGIMIKPDKTRP